MLFFLGGGRGQNRTCGVDSLSKIGRPLFWLLGSIWDQCSTERLHFFITVYVDMGADCVDLTFQLASTSTNAQWKIRITQYESGYTNLAPFGCTQYYWKQDSDSDGKGKIQSYNWAGSYHLADQNQKICIRREDDKTKICYSTNTNTDFAVSGIY